MGLGNLLKTATNSATDLVKKEIEKNNLQKQQIQRSSQHTHVALSIQSGAQQFQVSNQCYMRQRPEDGCVYFNYDENKLYNIISYEWDGPIYDSLTTSQTLGTSNSTTQKKGKTGRVLTGAAMGGLINPVGAIVGAAAGASGSSKSNTVSNSTSNTNSQTKQIEQLGVAVLTLERISDGSILSAVINCNSMIDAQIRCFQFKQRDFINEQKTLPEAHEELNEQKTTNNSLQELKTLKELLDMGAISEIEFNQKKKQLLDL